LTTDPDCDGCPEAIDYEIKEITVHPKYEKSSHDLALIRLSKVVDIEKSKYVTTICLPLKKENFLVTSPTPTFSVMGFGRMENKTRSTVMLQTRVPYVSPEKCNEFYEKSEVKSIEDYHLCAGSDGSDSCKGYKQF
jgi:Trypsin